jgi:hypothetical protein
MQYQRCEASLMLRLVWVTGTIGRVWHWVICPATKLSC